MVTCCLLSIYGLQYCLYIFYLYNINVHFFAQHVFVVDPHLGAGNVLLFYYIYNISFYSISNHKTAHLMGIHGTILYLIVEYSHGFCRNFVDIMQKDAHVFVGILHIAFCIFRQELPEYGVETSVIIGRNILSIVPDAAFYAQICGSV